MKVSYHIVNEVGVVTFQTNLTKLEIDKITFQMNDLLGQHIFSDVVFDLEKVVFIDSSGFGWLTQVYNQLLNENRKLVACHANEQIKALFRMTGVSKAILLYPSEGEALIAIQS